MTSDRQKKIESNLSIVYMFMFFCVMWYIVCLFDIQYLICDKRGLGTLMACRVVIRVVGIESVNKTMKTFSYMYVW